MPLYRFSDRRLTPVPAVTLESAGVLEVDDLQPALIDRLDALEEGLFLIANEFGEWEDSNRSIDLLALDRSGRLVVVELKRTQTGGHSELQAIRYAAMVANMTLEQVIEAHRDYLRKNGSDEDAPDRVLAHLGVGDEADADFLETRSPRILLAAGGFSTELTTTVLWLNEMGLDITCVRLQLYQRQTATGTELLMDTDVVLPLPEAQAFQVRLRAKREEERSAAGTNWLLSGDAFRERIATAPEEYQEQLHRLYSWAAALEQEDLCVLYAYDTKRPGEMSLLPWLGQRKRAGLITIYMTRKGPYVQFFRSVYERHAPGSLARVESVFGRPVRQGTTGAAESITDELLDAVAVAYREAKGGGP